MGGKGKEGNLMNSLLFEGNIQVCARGGHNMALFMGWDYDLYFSRMSVGISYLSSS